MLYKIRCKHPLGGALPVPYVPVRVARGALIAHRYTFPRRRASYQYRRTFIPISVSLWNDLVAPYLMVWDWRVSIARPMPFCWPSCSFLFYLQLFSLTLLFLYRLVVWGQDKGGQEEAKIRHIVTTISIKSGFNSFHIIALSLLCNTIV